MNVVVDSELHFLRDDLPPRMIQALHQNLTRANPDHQQRKRMKFSTKDIQPRFSFVRESGRRIYIPRGALSLLRDLAKAYNVSLEFTNCTTSNRGTGKTLADLPITLRDYQKQAVEKLLRRVQGYVRLPCGAGKTVLGCAAVVLSGESTVVLVHTVDLAKQWKDTFSKLYGVKVRSVKSWAPLVAGEVAVVMVQTLNKAGVRASAFLASAGCVMLDECHHVPASTFREIFKYTNARFRWGLTATPEREDGWGFALPMVIGPELFAMNTRDLLEAGHLIEPIILPVKSPANLDFDRFMRRGRLNMGAAVTALCEHQKRTKLILDMAHLGAFHGRTVLILVPRKAYAHQLADSLNKRGVSSVALTSSVGKRERDAALDSMRKQKISCAIATQLADEGLDVPALDMLILASTGRAAGRAVQRVGRVLRKHENKQTPLVVELIDSGPFFSQWNARKKVYFDELGVSIEDTVYHMQAIDELKKIFEKDRG